MLRTLKFFTPTKHPDSIRLPVPWLTTLIEIFPTARRAPPSRTPLFLVFRSLPARHLRQVINRTRAKPYHVVASAARFSRSISTTRIYLEARAPLRLLPCCFSLRGFARGTPLLFGFFPGGHYPRLRFSGRIGVRRAFNLASGWRLMNMLRKGYGPDD